jgi:hypothetical protein
MFAYYPCRLHILIFHGGVGIFQWLKVPGDPEMGEDLFLWVPVCKMLQRKPLIDDIMPPLYPKVPLSRVRRESLLRMA